LKDASATAIYGSTSAYGVVIINTKKGQMGATKPDVAVSTGVSSILKKNQQKDYQSDSKYLLFPIPGDQLVVNPYLKQNPSY
jgi:iron complex outermembrane receptor protein